MISSLFNICQPYTSGTMLLYNTYTTSMIEIENKIYDDIFNKNYYDNYQDEMSVLYGLGFLINDNDSELDKLESTRKTVIETNSGKIANIIIAPTLECNAHCFYCFEKGYRTGTMTAKTADALIDYLVENWNGERLGITWFGGEPLLASNIIDRISCGLISRQVIFSSKITTNGLLINDSIIDSMLHKWNVDKIQITIDAIGEEYNRIKQYNKEITNAFDIVMTNIKKVLDADIKLKIRINFDPEQQEKAIKTMQYLDKHFNEYENIKIYFAPIDADDEIVKNIVNDFDKYSQHPYIALIKFGRKHGLYRGFPDMEDDDALNLDFDEYGLLKKLKIYPSVTNCYATCPSVYSIDPNGKIYKCHRGLGQEEYASGDIFDGIEYNDIYNFFCNTSLTYDECKTCSILPICQGGCKINARLFHGKEACAPSKAIINELILLYKDDLDSMQNL